MAGEFGWGGLGGGPGGIAFPDILTALGTALLSSPRDAPFSNLPQTLQTGMQASQQRQSGAALSMALRQAGVDPQTADIAALNPTAASLLMTLQNQRRQLEQNAAHYGQGGAGNLGLGAPAATTPPAVPAPTAAPAPPVSAAPGMNPFTSLVMRSEGTDPSTAPQASGFNTTLGYGKFAGGQTNLTGMTVNQVLELQQRMLSHPENNLNSSAAGGFQVVGKTLRSLRDAGVVGGDDLYNEDTQTKIANHLAQNVRGRDVAGLKAEWRGLANVPDSQILSAYDAAYGSGRATAEGAPAASQPVRVAAGPGAKIALPVGTLPPAAPPPPPATTGENQTVAAARQQVNKKLYEMSNARAIGNEGLVEQIKLELQPLMEWLKPTERQRAFVDAGMDPNSSEAQAIARFGVEKPRLEFERQGQQFEAQQRQALRLGTMTPEEKYEISAGRSPTGLSTGTRLAAEVKGAEAAATTAGQERAKAAQVLPSAEATTQAAIESIKTLRNHPGREWATGGTSVFTPFDWMAIPGSDTADFIAQLDNLKGQLFRNAFDTLKGGGSVTEVEGTKATDAIGSLARKQSEGQFLKQLDTVEGVLQKSLDTLRAKAGVHTTTTMSPGEIAQSLANARSTLAKRPDLRDAIIKDLTSNGIDPRGL